MSEQDGLKYVTRINDKVYALDSFLERHPGGRDMLILANNRDSTGMFYSYHRDPAVAEAVLKKLPVVDGARVPASPEIAKYDFKSKTYTDLRERVNAYFRNNNLNSRGGFYMITKSLALVALYALVYWTSLSYPVLAPLVGILSSSLGLCVQHDANHGALTRSPLLNRMFGFLDDVIGGSALMWRHQHCVGHHVFCNDVNMDSDTYSQYPIMKMNPALPHRAYLKLQHMYAPILYSLIGVSYPIGDIQCFLEGRYAWIDVHPLSLVDSALYYTGKFLYVSLYYVVPFYVFGIAAIWTWLLPALLTGGFWLAALFAVSHNNNACEHNAETADWAAMQIRTSSNWASDSFLWNIACGGLNCQIEHHLFPGIAHEHYMALSKIVRQYCKEVGLPYNDYPTYREIFVDHLSFLYRMGHEKTPIKKT
eukprot:CAMPEP_0119131694 /NCGR_PEP_ID=MMETSP1310-20130426/10525_1 /TAXON_ID=464262 /ORGANISM="Genus nov. species nov., Strain RCC2339" /LENGTH=421 /DNA_ID=CAMNT_0007122285 /DNA_START=52 /DNA_END=1317 /DNA_ORIENTATION=-